MWSLAIFIIAVPFYHGGHGSLVIIIAAQIQMGITANALDWKVRKSSIRVGYEQSKQMIPHLTRWMMAFEGLSDYQIDFIVHIDRH